MRQPMKPHRDGFEDEEDCEGHFDPDEAERRGCHHILNRSSNDPCEICFNQWRAEEDAKHKATWDAKTPEEKARIEEFLAELRKLY